MLDEIKKAVRVSDEEFNSEIEELIEACKADLQLAGILKDVVESTEPNALIKRAITIYCKANFGIDNPDFEKFNDSYNMLKNHLAISKEFTAD